MFLRNVYLRGYYYTVFLFSHWFHKKAFRDLKAVLSDSVEMVKLMELYCPMLGFYFQNVIRYLRTATKNSVAKRFL